MRLGAAGCAMILAGPALASEVRWRGSVDLGASELGLILVVGDAGATLSIPAQGLTDGPLRDVVIADDALSFTLGLDAMPEAAWARFTLAVDASAGSASGTMLQFGRSFPVTLRRLADGEPAAARRPQEPRAPLPYAEREVSVRHGDVVLAGTLTVPEGPGPHPAVVLLTGSGAQDRDEALLGHRPFLVIADHLARHGVAVLRMDDRGVGGSSSPDPASDVTLDYVDDALAAVAFLGGQAEVDARRVGLVGHSEGAIVAAFAAARSRDVAWVVMLGGPSLSGRDLLVAQVGALAAASGAEPGEVATVREREGELLDALIAGEPDEAILERLRAQGMGDAQAAAALRTLGLPWFRAFVALDPADALRRMRCPLLAMYGSLDRQVPPDDNAPRLRALTRRDRDVTVEVLPGLNHLFQTATTGLPAEYGVIEETFAPAALDLLGSWITARAAAR